LTYHESSDGYRVEIAVRSEGIARVLSRFRGTAVADGNFAANGSLRPLRYTADYDLRKRKNSKLRVMFVARGGAVIAERGLDDTSRKKPLAEAFRRNVLDPLSAIEAARAAVRRGETAFTVPVYDGARRFDAIVHVDPRGHGQSGIRLAMILHAIAGFKGESSDDPDPDDAPRRVSAALSDDAALVPLSLSVPIWFLPLDVTLVRVCTANETCDLTP
jgi:hypothetical protein